MKTKNFLVSGITGGIADFFLGWLFYGIIFKDMFEQPDESSNALLMIFLGCLAFGLLIALIFTKWAQITTALTGVKAGAMIGLLISLMFNFFVVSMGMGAEHSIILDVIISTFISAIVGAIIGVVNGKLG